MLLCREIDTNLDGIKDVVRTFNEKGEPLHEEADTNYDGKIDDWMNFVDGRIAEEDVDTTLSDGPAQRVEVLRRRSALAHPAQHALPERQARHLGDLLQRTASSAWATTTRATATSTAGTATRSCMASEEAAQEKARATRAPRDSGTDAGDRRRPSESARRRAAAP